jgi:AcrR family transcriptional regulator
MNDVADAAGVARATVYRYFPNRDALLDELARAAVADVEARLASARIDAVAPEEGIAGPCARSSSGRLLRAPGPRAASLGPERFERGRRRRCAGCSSAARPPATSATTSRRAADRVAHRARSSASSRPRRRSAART